MANDVAPIWERIGSEPGKAFEAFEMYRGMGPTRSTTRVAEALAKKGQQVRLWSSRYDWVVRCHAYDMHCAAQRDQARTVALCAEAVDWVARRRDHVEEEWDLRTQLVAASREALRRFHANPDRFGTLEGIARMLELASKLGRLASGMPTDHTEVSGEVTARIDPEWEAAMKKVYGDPAAAPAAIEVQEVREVPHG